MKKKVLLAFVLLFALVFNQNLPNVKAATTKPTVVLDPGHGGKYGGTVGYSGNRTGYYEKHANLEVSNRLRDELVKLGFQVKMTRSTDKLFSSSSASTDLKERMKVANGFVAGNNDNSIFISVHHNATSSPTYGGYETYYFNSNYPDRNYPADPMQTAYSPESQRLANLTHSTVLSKGVKEGRGIVPGVLYVTRSAQMPSILLEVGYMSNPTEEAMIKTSAFQSKIAKAVAEGVNKFYNVYVVNDAKGKALKTFSSKTDALNFSKSVKSSYVIYKKTGEVVGSTPPPTNQPAPLPTLAFGVYHSATEMKDNLFATEKDATAYAKKWKNTRVVNLKDGTVLWSNYLPQKYIVKDGSDKELKRFYQEQQAVDYAKKQAKASVIDSSITGGDAFIIWSDAKAKNFIVRSKDKGDMVALYNREEAKSYAALWPNSEVYDVWAKKAIYTNANKTKYSYSAKDIYAKDRLLTAIEVSKHLYPSGFASSKKQKTVVIATSHEYADALSAGPLASYYGNAPILLNKKDKLSDAVQAELKRLKANHVILVGGTVALSADVETKIKSLGMKVERLSGATRYETNEKINSKMPNADGALVASGGNYPDALTAASVGVVKNWPIVLVKDKMPASLQKAYGDQVVIVGGTTAVSTQLEEEVGKKVGKDNVVRLSGATRYDTSNAVVSYFSEDFVSNELIVSVGTNYPDALVSSALSAKYKAPLILTKDASIPETVKSLVKTQSTEKLINRTNYVGGTISNSVKTTINGLQK
ncbi:N-acetylmuramoyl-L-alanine amidase [Planococcus sp. YIM B11945]|uniref:N-acetylmuramoyl-L-alanine amidase n=1 Tax=Planococcus sp. YIM B11945 TaxID=3435410 RepID=UPI003D7D498C